MYTYDEFLTAYFNWVNHLSNSTYKWEAWYEYCDIRDNLQKGTTKQKMKANQYPSQVKYHQ